jgi:plastocyanin
MEKAPWDDAWQAILEWLTPLVSPSWNDLIPLLPLGLFVLIILVLALLVWRWRALADINRPRVARPRTVATPPEGIHLPGPSLWPFVVPVGAAIILFGLVLRPTNEAGEPTGPFNLPLLVLGLAVSVVAVAGWFRDAMSEWRTTAAAAHATSHAIAGGYGDHRGLLPATVPATPVEAREPPPGIHLPGPSPWPFLAPVGLAVFFFGLVFSPAIVVGGVVMSAIAAVGWLRDAGHEYHAVETGGHAPAGRAFPTALVGVYALIAALSVAATAAPKVIALVNASPSPEASASAGPASDRVQLVAKDVKFDKSQITVPAGKNVTIVFDNQDAVPHNVAIYDSAERTKELFVGELQQTAGQITYQVPAQPPGSYYFVCSVHPTMNGTYVAQ